MEGKRFAAGLVGGLLVGLVIVTATSGFTFGLYGSFSSVNNNVGMQLSSETGAKSTSSTGSQPLSPPSQNSSNSTFSTAGRSTTTATTSSSPPVADLSPANGVKFSSHVDSIAQQPVLTNAFILLPVLFAFLLGAVIYRASMKREGNTVE
ncbi:MAG TPA: hypothetical protein VGR56_10885 [Nitrososphaerales archaeon]|nr:hypothetical protein [Nitrososphaerales archaeon]